ncbi:MAG: hypothetical protein PHO07_12270 [Pirellulales bacterium]|jgi:hypothetical protein|nr:hypothetical protein [Thermoguttaceae bacterium]MDD4787941.1 hypothetical protein [Pirellulales bacterium]MDI9445504.1 hypothetical protein [Planctomycetota bacterium]NLY99567.1 hypothetical protein [Pirellulaceae bacterium]
MRKLVARSIVVALGVLLVCGCSSTGGKSPSVASLNPMKYFAKSKPVPKPSQMTPNVSLPSADGLALTDSKPNGGFAPPSPYAAGAADGKQPKDAFAGQYASTADPAQNASPATSASLAAGPQQGMYDPNGYAGATATSGYALPKSNSLTGTTPSDSTGPYGLGGSRYDIQNPGLSSGPLAGGSTIPSSAGRSLSDGQQAAPNSAGSGSAYNQTASYQASPLPSPAGARTGTLQGTYPSTGTYQADPSAVYGTWNNGTNPSAVGGYAGSAMPASTDRRDIGGIASLPTSPAASAGLASSTGTAEYNYQNYQPGVTGYQPPNVPAYTPPIGYVQPSSSSGTAPAAEPGYSPGTTSRYPSSTVQPATTNGTLPYSASPATYPSTTYGSSGVLY